MPGSRSPSSSTSTRCRARRRGPGALLTTLVGWKTAGWIGAVVASLALFVPSSVMAYLATLAWVRNKEHPLQRTAERGLAPIATGLILASAFAVMRASSGTLLMWGIAAVALGIFLTRPKINPLIVLFAAGVVHAGVRALM